jgi:hypothetical protein
MAESTTDVLDETEEETAAEETEADEKPKAKGKGKGKKAAAAEPEPEPEAPLSKDGLYLEECGWERSPSGRKWKCTSHAKPYRNEMGQHEYANEHRAYSTEEALRVQKLVEDHVVYLKRLAEEREKRRIREATRQPS